MRLYAYGMMQALLCERKRTCRRHVLAKRAKRACMLSAAGTGDSCPEGAVIVFRAGVDTGRYPPLYGYYSVSAIGTHV